MRTLKDILGSIIGHVDYTQNCCSPTAMIGAAIPEELLLEARRTLLDADMMDPLVPETRVVMDCIDFTRSACSPFERVAAVLPAEVITRAVKAYKETP